MFYDTISFMKNLLKIVKDNKPSLRQKCKEVTEIDDKVISLVNSMHDYLVASQDEEVQKRYGIREGVGLAAPQIGENIRALVVYFVDVDENGKEVIVDHRLINPKIILESVKEAYLSGGEGCLSVDRAHEGYVYRKYKIQVKAFNALTMKEEIITARGYEAVVLQHEIDHLDGILYYDRINKNDPFFKKIDAIEL